MEIPARIRATTSGQSLVNPGTSLIGTQRSMFEYANSKSGGITPATV